MSPPSPQTQPPAGRMVVSLGRPADGGAATGTTSLIVTIDGPAGTGKSSVARALARRLGLDFLDTGAMYRAAALIALERGLTPADEEPLLEAVSQAQLHFDWTTDPPALISQGASVMDRIRHPDVTAIVSPISGIAQLRRLMVRKQRAIAARHPRLVTEGRDQGSEVFPDADVKIYLYADATVRAARRAEQLRAAGQPADLARLMADIVERDRSDAARHDGPLTCPEGAHRVDTSGMTFHQVVDTLEGLVLAHLGARSKKKADRAMAGHA
jgi:cytidylate kinase